MPKQEGVGELILKGFLQISLQFFSPPLLNSLTSGLGVGECVSGRRVFKRSVATCSHSTPTQWVAGGVEERANYEDQGKSRQQEEKKRVKIELLDSP